MRTYTLLAFVVAAAVVVAGASRPRRDKYTTQYDNVDILDILHNERLFEIYEKCLLDEGPCPNDAKILREAIPDALTNGCEKCSLKQKDGARIAIKYIREEKPLLWGKLKKKHDATGIYEAKYQKELERL